jgi:DNA-binding FrmR family transcriptional regulator
MADLVDYLKFVCDYCEDKGSRLLLPSEKITCWITGAKNRKGLAKAFWPAKIGVGSTPNEEAMTNTISLPIFADDLQRGIQERLSRIEGQIRGIARMVEGQRPCIEVLQQLASVQAALRGLTKTVLRNYLERCATDAIRSGETSVYDELMEAIYKFVK